MPKFLRSLSDRDVSCIGLTEHASLILDKNEGEDFRGRKVCLVFGSEDRGLSHVIRVLPKKFSLKSLGKIKSLNVSVAAAISMEKIFVK